MNKKVERIHTSSISLSMINSLSSLSFLTRFSSSVSSSSSSFPPSSRCPCCPAPSVKLLLNVPGPVLGGKPEAPPLMALGASSGSAKTVARS